MDFTLKICIWEAFTIFSVTRAFSLIYDNSTEVSNTIDQILKRYDVRLRPNFGADPLYVGIVLFCNDKSETDMSIEAIHEISEVNMDYTLTIFLNQYWKDERLAYSTKELSITFTGEFSKRIWVPDLFFPGDKDSFIHSVTSQNQMVKLFGDGSIMYGMRFTTKHSCQMDLRDYPIDSQKCTVEIESYGYTVSDVVMYWKENPVLGMNNIKLPQYQITNYHCTDRTEQLATGVYQRLTLTLTMQRKFGYFFFQMYLPSILIVMLSWISFWVHNDATAARVALGITTVLTMTTINNSVRSSLPRISYVKAIDIYLVVCFLFVFAALIEYAAVNYIYWERKKERKLPEPSKFSKYCTRQVKSFKISRKKVANLYRTASKSRKKLLEPGPSTQLSPKVSIEVENPINRNKPLGFISSRLSIPEKPRVFRSSSLSVLSRTVESIDSGPLQSSIPLKVKSNSKLPKIAKVWQKILQTFKSNHKSVDVTIVDNFSRICFPSAFLIFNTLYWSFYVLKNNDVS